MSKVFDVVLASNDMSLDRVLDAGLPVAMVFYDKDLPADLRKTTDDLARQSASRLLIVTLAGSDAPQSASRFGVRRFPTLVTVRDGRTVMSREGVRACRFENPRCLSSRRRTGSKPTRSRSFKCAFDAGDYQESDINQ